MLNDIRCFFFLSFWGRSFAVLKSLNTRIAEHKKVARCKFWKFANHVHHFNQNMDFANVKDVGFEANYHEQLFLETSHSTLDPNTGNYHIVLPEAYKGIARA